MGDQGQQWSNNCGSRKRSEANGGWVRHGLMHFGSVCLVEWLAREDHGMTEMITLSRCHTLIGGHYCILDFNIREPLTLAVARRCRGPFH